MAGMIGLTRRRLATALAVGMLACAVSSHAGAEASGSITITGRINACYKFKHGVVRLSALRQHESVNLTKLIPVDKHGRFTISIPAKGFTYGDYWLEFGEGPADEGMGGGRYTIDAPNVDLGTIGDCDV